MISNVRRRLPSFGLFIDALIGAALERPLAFALWLAAAVSPLRPLTGIVVLSMTILNVILQYAVGVWLLVLSDVAGERGLSGAAGGVCGSRAR